MFFGFAAAGVCAGVGFALVSTIGVTVDCAAGAGGAAGFAADDEVATAGAGAVVCVVTVRLAKCVVGAGRATAVRVVRVVVRAALCAAVAGVAVSVVVVSGAGVVVSVVAGAAGVVSVVVAGGGEVVTGCASWASALVEMSAKAAAIAGNALVRA